jgi:hypothetical protein
MLKGAVYHPKRLEKPTKFDQSMFTNAIEMHVANQPTKIKAWPADVKAGTLRIKKLLAILLCVSECSQR